MSQPRTRTAKINGPTLLTISRIFLSILFFALVLTPERWTRIFALIVFIIASITDLIDGKWARKSKMVTDLGAFLDPIADKMLVNLAFLALIYLYVIPVWVFAIILVRDFAVDGMRMMAAKNKITIAASFYGKLKTTMQMIALIILLLTLTVNQKFLTITGDVTLYIALALTVISGIDYLIKGWKLIAK